ncbi:MAG: TrmB family transcriptional regulator [Deltaproteobacteria bacterium]|nr:TrmB family transcriptional regulator [Deltaproteobacteria bacterium]
MQDETQITGLMKRIGLGEYESRAYLALLKANPINGYEISKISGVPRSRIYEVLNGLIQKQMVHVQPGQKIKRYLPVKPEIALKRIQDTFTDAVEKIDHYTKSIRQVDTGQQLRVVQGRGAIIAFLKDLIKSTENRLVLSIWAQEAAALQDAIDGFIARKGRLSGIYFGEKSPYDQLVIHRRIQQVFNERKSRFLVAVIDNNQAVSGVLDQGDESQVTWTHNNGFVEMSKDYIVHDMSLNLLLKQVEGPIRQTYEDFLDNLREEYFGK